MAEAPQPDKEKPPRNSRPEVMLGPSFTSIVLAVWGGRTARWESIARLKLSPRPYVVFEPLEAINECKR